MDIAVRAFWLAILLAAAGCATTREGERSEIRAQSSSFQFQRDTFAYSNQLVWAYRLDAETGTTITSKREPPPTYTHRCFVMVRAARQFFDHARFDPALPRATNYVELVRKVLARSPRKPSLEVDKVIIPGYGDLRSFSRDHSELLQRKCGGPWQSYFQRGHWRMIFPFTRAHQRRTADKLLAQVNQHRPQVVHVVRFPSLAINHALLVYGVESATGEIRFLAYDPNNSDAHSILTFDVHQRRFSLPANDYFPRGGRVDVYQIFTGALY